MHLHQSAGINWNKVQSFVSDYFGPECVDRNLYQRLIMKPSLLNQRQSQTKILLTGTFASGKTTLFDRLKSIDTITPISEAARPLLDEFPKLETNWHFQEILLQIQLIREYKALAENSKIILCDRGVLDIYCYSSYFNHRLVVGNMLDLAIYDRIFITNSFDINVATLNFSQYDLDMRSKLEQTFIEKLAGYELTMLSGSIIERLQQLVNSLSSQSIVKFTDEIQNNFL